MMATLLLLTMGCAPEPVPQDFVNSAPGDGRIPLRWVPVADESWEEALDGLWWSLAGLGAQPDLGAVHEIEPDDDGVRFMLDPWALGLSDPALEALLAALEPVEVARLDQGMPWTDVGRVLQRTLYEPWVYYAVTGACASVDLPLGRLPADAGEAAITESQLTDGDRRVRFAGGAATVEDIIWVAEGGGCHAVADPAPFEQHGPVRGKDCPVAEHRCADEQGSAMIRREGESCAVAGFEDDLRPAF